MKVPQKITDEIRSLETDIADITLDAERRIRTLRDRIAIYNFVVDAFCEQAEALSEVPLASKPQPNDEISVADRIVAVLTNAGKPMSATDVVAALSRHGIPRNTVSARLSLLAQEGRISHEGPGQWAAL